MSRPKKHRAEKKHPPAKNSGQIWLMILVGLGAVIILSVPPDVFKSKAPSRSVPEPASGAPFVSESSRPLPLASSNPSTGLPLSTNLAALSNAEKSAHYQNL